jgi:methylated-DNA-protein-cysteine methyltransferase related protein
MPEPTTPTSEQVATLMAQLFTLVKACPPGRATTYGWLAKTLGYPRGARMAGWIMNEAFSGIPAQRVLNSKGELTGSWAFGHPQKMRELLEAEGIAFAPDGHVDLKRYGWDPNTALSDSERSQLLQTASSLPVTVSPRLLHLMRTDPASPLRQTPLPPDASM